MVLTWVLLAVVALVGLSWLRGGVAGSAAVDGPMRRWRPTPVDEGYDVRA
jgi:hypothetical protein